MNKTTSTALLGALLLAGCVSGPFAPGPTIWKPEARFIYPPPQGVIVTKAQRNSMSLAMMLSRGSVAEGTPCRVALPTEADVGPNLRAASIVVEYAHCNGDESDPNAHGLTGRYESLFASRPAWGDDPAQDARDLVAVQGK